MSPTAPKTLEEVLSELLRQYQALLNTVEGNISIQGLLMARLKQAEERIIALESRSRP